MNTAFLLLLVMCAKMVIAQLPDAPQPRVGDKKFFAIAAADLSSSFTDAYLSHKYVHQEFGCHESFPLLGPRPSAARGYAVILGMTAGVVAISYWLKRKFKTENYWAYPMLGETATHGLLIRDIMSHCHR